MTLRATPTLNTFSDLARPTAEVVDGLLMLSIPTANNPCVWQMNLAEAPMLNFEIKEKEDGSWKLYNKIPGARQQDIAEFRTRHDALEALGVASQALHTAHGSLGTIQVATGSNQNELTAVPTQAQLDAIAFATQSTQSQTKGSWVGAILKVFGVLAILYVGAMVTLYNFMPQITASAIANLEPAAGGPVTRAARPTQQGEAIPADQFFSQNRSATR